MNPTFTQIHAPKIYVYSDSRYPNCLKVGYTAQETVMERMKQHYPTITPSQSWKLEFESLAIKDDGGYFKDFAVHKMLEKMGIKRIAGEWFECDIDTIKNAILNIKQSKTFERQRTQDFKMRPEQLSAVQKTANYFNLIKQDKNNHRTPHFLWNAKMRFGKTFATYQLAKKMNWQRVLILTFKPAVKNAWEEDLTSHIDFNGWQFISRDSELKIDNYDKTKPMVYFASFQDVLGKDRFGNIKAKNEWIHTINWDCVVFDEYHFGAWRDSAKSLFAKDDELAQMQNEYQEMEIGVENFNENELPITTEHYLYLSGTPFRAIASGEFIEEQIFNWTYGDEQREKLNWDKTKGDNPYLSLPQMMLLTYQLPENIRHIATQGEFNEFDLGEFFKADGNGETAKFKHENYVQKWLDLIRDNLDEMIVTNLKQGNAKPPMPFSDVNLLNSLLHTLWFLPSVASCFAMANLLKAPNNKFYHDYDIIVSAGNNAGMGDRALIPVKNAMTNNPLATKSITLSCGKLMTGVSVPAWTGIFMLRNCSSPETYFQAGFRVQTPWTVRGDDGVNIIKNQCYIFDFAPNRALRQIADYAHKLNPKEGNPESKVAEFIAFLPVLAYDGSAMQQVDAKLLLDMAMSGTTATLLARRWQSALLVNVDDITLKNLMANKDALDALDKLEGFRNLNEDIQIVINRSERIKAIKQKAKENELSDDEKKELKKLTDEEKDKKSKRQEIKEKLIKFATRIPIFMYLSDFREHSLKDVIQELEPELFTKVTGLTQKDFQLLVSLNVFDESVMNDAVYKFKRYEDSSLEYAGIDKKTVYLGLFNTVVSRSQYESLGV
ncbi:DEAD/DEAH box helicase [Moraxella bovis]|uniref:GIY-YIG nuclease family protein n=1 Tax=Moraxella bovis TaxID=476 RepID=A0ABY6M8I4_MORBO|nr:GIY-YIG nuclease family protein [Moraxella bovis]UYZ75916.1 GIY-YIG nuclease family protein [Moraxella bovis]UYZ78143.1 GIY-YIG nuclease family protein [Moraxella bovis]UYZ86626.1 GIY-YIG nuclease family protein [Moraxella bovis]UYZ92050.1 GIY-YIG nuclease family protein [Moraxella bovis]UYZ98031.1 GIY-YIG nuclease family protein [Moraxella bovis]